MRLNVKFYSWEFNEMVNVRFNDRVISIHEMCVVVDEYNKPFKQKI